MIMLPVLAGEALFAKVRDENWKSVEFAQATVLPGICIVFYVFLSGENIWAPIRTLFSLGMFAVTLRFLALLVIAYTRLDIDAVDRVRSSLGYGATWLLLLPALYPLMP